MQKDRIFVILSITYFLLFLNLNVIYYFREEPYIRPEFYFILLSIASGLIFIQIKFLNKKEIFKVLLFLEILLIPISFTLTQQGLYHTVMGRDPWTHGVLIAHIIKNAYIPPYEVINIPYVWMPNFHLIISQYMLVSNIGYKWASYLSIGILTLVLECLVAYKLGLFIFRSNIIAFLSVLFLAISDNVLDMTGKSIIPNSIGVAIAFLVFYLILTKNELEAKHKITITIIILIVGLSFLHTISFAFMIIQTTFIFFTFLLYGNIKKAKSIGQILLAMWILAIFSWGLISGLYLKSFISLLNQLIMGLNIEQYKRSLTIPFWLVLLARLGMIIYFGLAGIGILYHIYNNNLSKLYKKELTPAQLSMLINSSFFVGFGILTFLIWPEIAHRFWYYGEILGSFFVAYLIVQFITQKSKYLKEILAVCVILILSWLMFVASVSNDDNPLIREYTIRTGLYDSEIQTALFVLSKADLPIASDWDYIFSMINVRQILINNISSNPSLRLNVEFPKTFREIFIGHPNSKEYLFIFRSNLIKNRAFDLELQGGKVLHPPLDKEINKIIKIIFINRDVVYNTKIILIFKVNL